MLRQGIKSINQNRQGQENEELQANLHPNRGRRPRDVGSYEEGDPRWRSP